MHNNDSSDFKDWANALRERFEQVADKSISCRENALGVLSDSMRYAVLDGGKRVRALFCYAAGMITRADVADVDHAAKAIEYIHGYSLVHDDMPCMDNDTLRRGKPTCHVKFGEAVAMLAGDALQPQAFAELVSSSLDAERKVALVAELARASGIDGMCGGQMIDLQSVGKKIDIETLRRMHAMKTGALIGASVRMGALCGDSKICEAVMPHLDVYATSLGLAFQVVDDILDVVADTATLGKTAGKDMEADKPTYVSLLGLEKARELAAQCRMQALDALGEIERCPLCESGCTVRLREIADYVIGRSY